jgi:hypothetical protein
MALYVKVDTKFLSNKHMVKVGPSARLLYLGGLAYCVEHLTDGIIPKNVLRMIADVDDRTPQLSARRLRDAGRWVDLGDSWQVHGYTDEGGQCSAETVYAKRAADAERQAKYRVNKRMSQGESQRDKTPLSRCDSQRLDPDPDPDPLIKDSGDSEKPFEVSGDAVPASPVTKTVEPSPKELAHIAAIAEWPTAADSELWAFATEIAKRRKHIAPDRAVRLAAEVMRLHGVTALAALTPQNRSAMIPRLSALAALEPTPASLRAAWARHSAARGFPGDLGQRMQRIIDGWHTGPQEPVQAMGAIQAMHAAGDRLVGCGPNDTGFETRPPTLLELGA